MFIETPPNQPVRLAPLVITPLVIDAMIITFGPPANPRSERKSNILKIMPKVPAGGKTPPSQHQDAVLDDLMISSSESCAGGRSQSGNDNVQILPN